MYWFSVLTLSAVDCGFKPLLVQNKNFKISICCFSAKHTYAAFRSKSKDWLARRNLDNIFEWNNMSFRGQLFQWASSIKIKLSVLVYYIADIIISSDVNCSRHDIGEKQYSLTHYRKVAGCAMLKILLVCCFRMTWLCRA